MKTHTKSKSAVPNFLYITLFFGVSFSGLSDTLNFTSIADSEISTDNPNLNFASGGTVVSGALGTGAVRRSLYKFDVSGIPANATVTSASVTVSVEKVPSGGGADSTFDLRRVQKKWTETGVTWNSPWTSPGASDASDVSTSASSSVAIASGVVGPYSFPSSGGLVTDVQLWATNPAANFGWLLISQDEVTLKTARRFGAKEDPASAPILTVNFTLPPPPVNTNFALVNLVASGNQFRFSFYADSNKTYTVESLANLSTTNWLTVTNYGSLPTAGVRIVTNALTSSNGFFRVRTP